MSLEIDNQQYWDEVRAMAVAYSADGEEFVLAMQYDDNADQWDCLHQAIDAHPFIIYTHSARHVMIHTDNPDAYRDEMGENPPSVEAEAYFAMMQDIVNHPEFSHFEDN